MITYAKIIGESIVDGPGIRTTVFLQGCPRNCEGCHNPELLPVTGGITVDENELVDLILKEVTSLHKGITFSGGDPFLQEDALYNVITDIKNREPRLDIWVYTGYLLEDVLHFPIMPKIDVLVDGEFILTEKDLTLKFRGSRNQRIINVTKSIQHRDIILKEI